MKSSNYNNLLELFYFKYQSKDKDEIFLQSLKNKSLKFTWEQTYSSIQKFSNYLSSIFIPTIDVC